MLIFGKPAHRVYGSYRFWVELDGLLTAGFTEVSGLQSEIETHEYQEGGLNQYSHHFPKRVKYPNLVLKRGISGSDELWNWYSAVIAGQYQRKNGSIILMNQAGHEVQRWNFFNAFPVKWSGPDFNAARNEIGIETLELTHTGLKTVLNKGLLSMIMNAEI